MSPESFAASSETHADGHANSAGPAADSGAGRALATPIAIAPDTELSAFVPSFRGSAPYIHAFRGKTFVVAFGGEVVADDTFPNFIADLNLLASLGIRLVLVHGARL